ncbi:NAD(P)-binding domain-containing protein [Mycolicibacterium flavescens]|uniref:NAD(P)-binding domain-containing protein n=1 Tax=Mycolicibacterium flavescens TaxID=1776 RepID=UPI0027E2CFCF|nr:NAD(P)-binding domain-containing protein [Mycolicibacterium flavescens]
MLDARYRTTVWNRTEAKAREVLDRGAVWAPSSAGAVAASDVTLIWPVRNPSATDPPPSTSVSDEVASVT